MRYFPNVLSEPRPKGSGLARQNIQRLLPLDAAQCRGSNCHQVLGDHSEGDPPVPIPNTEVKPLSPDGTARASVWESRKLPGLFQSLRFFPEAFLFFPARFALVPPIVPDRASCYSRIAFDSFSGRVYPSVVRSASVPPPMSPLSNRQEDV